MGLDMRLYKRMYVRNWEHSEEKKEVTVKIDGKIIKGFDNPSYITQEVAYWRKFNALHGYIVDNFANGEDICQEIWLDYDDIESILKALKNEENQLEPTEGFFFGSQEKDEWYYEDVENAIKVFESILKDSISNLYAKI